MRTAKGADGAPSATTKSSVLVEEVAEVAKVAEGEKSLTIHILTQIYGKLWG
jgi:hypothetical protein